MLITQKNKKKIRIGIVSSLLPPAGFGHSIVISRLLSGTDPENYFLISSADQSAEGISNSCPKLPGKYYQLNKFRQLPYRNLLKLNYIVPVSNFVIQLYTRMKEIVRILRHENCDLLVACSGDLYDIPAAFWASRKLGIPFVPYMFDDYLYQWTGMSRSIVSHVEPYVLTRSDSVIVPNEFLQKEYRQRYNIKATVLHNPCEMPDSKSLEGHSKWFSDETYNIVYAGSVYHAHYDAFKNLVAAIESLNNEKIKLHIFSEQPRDVLEASGIRGSMIEKHPHISQSEIKKVLHDADILFLPLAFNSPIHEVIKTSAPGKTGEYLVSGSPILVHAPADTFISWYFREHECGIVVDQPDVEQLASSISRLMTEPEFVQGLAIRSINMAEQDFSIDVMQRRFQDFIVSRIDEKRSMISE